MAGKVEFGAKDVKGPRTTIYRLLDRHGINAMEIADPVLKSESLREQTDQQLLDALNFPSVHPAEAGTTAAKGILTEAGEFLITESGDFIIQE